MGGGDDTSHHGGRQFGVLFFRQTETTDRTTTGRIPKSRKPIGGTKGLPVLTPTGRDFGVPQNFPNSFLMKTLGSWIVPWVW